MHHKPPYHSMIIQLCLELRLERKKKSVKMKVFIVIGALFSAMVAGNMFEDIGDEISRWEDYKVRMKSF